MYKINREIVASILHQMPNEYFEKMSKIQKEIWANKTEDELESFREKCRQRQLGKIPSEETRKKRSETMKEGYRTGKYNRRKGREAWNKGCKLTDKEKEKLGDLTRGKIHITNGTINKMIYPEKLPEWIDKGFHKGRTMNKRRK